MTLVELTTCGCGCLCMVIAVVVALLIGLAWWSVPMGIAGGVAGLFLGVALAKAILWWQCREDKRTKDR